MTAAVNNDFQDYDPRNRLVGAIVLVLIAIVFLPMLFTQEGSKEVSDSPVAEVMEITQDGKKVFVSRIAPVKPPADEKQRQPQKPESDASHPVNKKADSAATATTKEETVLSKQAPSSLFKPITIVPANKPATNTSSTAKSAEKKKPASATTPAAQQKSSSSTRSAEKKTASSKTATKKAAAKSGWLLQIGVFSKAENAAKQAAKLRAKGFTVHTGLASTSKGRATKVWLGPFNERKTAEKMQGIVSRSTGQRGIVVANK